MSILYDSIHVLIFPRWTFYVIVFMYYNIPEMRIRIDSTNLKMVQRWVFCVILSMYYCSRDEYSVQFYSCNFIPDMSTPFNSIHLVLFQRWFFVILFMYYFYRDEYSVWCSQVFLFGFLPLFACLQCCGRLVNMDS